jgi:hypothetical protein
MPICKFCKKEFASIGSSDRGKRHGWYDCAKRIADERPYLIRALKFYATATDADWKNDNGFNANAALGSEVHASDCATHNEPALPAGSCDCAASGG